MNPGPFEDVAYAFLSILFEGAPFIFVGTLISGFIDAYLPAGLIDRWLPKRRWLAVMLSGLLGFVFPVCECAIVPVIRRLIQKGLPISCAITYMLSAPIINPIVVLSTWRAFSGWEEMGANGELVNQALFVTCSRLLIAYLITVSIGLIILRLTPDRVLKPAVLKGLEKSKRALARDKQKHEHEDDHDHHHHHEAPAGERKLVLAMRSAMRDFLDTAMYFTIGVLITAVFNTQVDQTSLDALAGNDLLGAGAMMGMAFVLSLCSTSDAFIAATFSTREIFGLGARLAFLIYGPMMDVKLIFMYSSVFKKRFVVVLGVGLFIVIGLICTFWVRVTL